MDKSLLIWICIAAVGGVAGIFIKLRWIVFAVVALFFVFLAGLLLNISLGGGETLTWVFGLGMMAIPLAGTLAIGGAAISGAITRGKHQLAKPAPILKNDAESEKAR
jgi:hypothetical protein